MPDSLATLAKTGSSTVTVGCRIPNGLVLRLFDMEDHDEQLMGGGVKTVRRAVPSARLPVKLNGPARFQGKDAEYQILHGVGLTHNVDAEFFAESQRKNRRASYADPKMLFAQAKSAEAEAEAKDKRSLMSGLERFNPDKPPAEFLGKIKTAEKA